jgi:Tfp pilus assembly protein PilF
VTARLPQVLTPLGSVYLRSGQESPAKNEFEKALEETRIAANRFLELRNAHALVGLPYKAYAPLAIPKAYHL